MRKYPMRKVTREFTLCTCGCSKDNHKSSWFSRGECQDCECPKYGLSGTRSGTYQECPQYEATMSTTRTWTGVKTYWKKA